MYGFETFFRSTSLPHFLLVWITWASSVKRNTALLLPETVIYSTGTDWYWTASRTSISWWALGLRCRSTKWCQIVSLLFAARWCPAADIWVDSDMIKLTTSLNGKVHAHETRIGRKTRNEDLSRAMSDSGATSERAVTSLLPLLWRRHSERPSALWLGKSPNPLSDSVIRLGSMSHSMRDSIG